MATMLLSTLRAIMAKRSQARPKAELRVKRGFVTEKLILVLPRVKFLERTRPFLREKQLADFYHQADGIPHGKSTHMKLQRSVSMRHFLIWPEEAVDIPGEYLWHQPALDHARFQGKSLFFVLRLPVSHASTT